MLERHKKLAGELAQSADELLEAVGQLCGDEPLLHARGLREAVIECFSEAYPQELTNQDVLVYAEAQVEGVTAAKVRASVSSLVQSRIIERTGRGCHRLIL